jgi:XTP/dITP diphosphohydrolase
LLSLIFATNNANKVAEIQKAFNKHLKIISLKQAGIDIEIEEPYNTLEENAQEKCTVIHQLTSIDCFAEDTGLEVAALNNKPGVKSARYAGEQRSDSDNIKLLLHNLTGITNRTARFRTVIALIWQGKEYLFEGICIGTITVYPRGINGFGYDPIFVPDGSNKTFAEMELDEKNKFSHRKKAMAKMVEFIMNEQPHK